MLTCAFPFSLCCFFAFFFSSCCFLKLYAGLPPISGNTPLSSLPQDSIFTATSILPSATKEVNHPHTRINTSPLFPGPDPVGDPDVLSKAGSVDMDMLDLGLSLLTQSLHSGSLGEGSSLTAALSFLFLSFFFHQFFCTQAILTHFT